MRHCIFCIFLFVAFALAAKEPALLPQIKREKPDIELIKQEISDPKSKYYYPRLMEEFLRNDTVMKLDKYRRLYIGFMFQEDYTPYRSANHPVIYQGDARPSRQECDSIISYAQKALDDNPFDLQQMTLMINALRIKGETNKAAIWQYKLNYILMAIVSTGTGEDEENAWVVIEPQHEYVLLNMMNYLVDDHIFYDPYYEFITVTDMQGNRRGGYYFNIKNLLEEYYRKHPDELEAVE